MMSHYRLGKRSLQRLEGVHPDLIKVIERAIEITEVDFTVLEGLRTIERQKKLLAKGASTSLKSRHLSGHAVDLGAYIDNRIEWSWPPYYQISAAMKKASKELKIPITWGGNWRKFPDGPHFQLKWKQYPE